MVIAVSDGYDSQSKARKVHRGVKNLMNDIFLDDLADKTHRGVEGQVLKNFWGGGRPYGYRFQQEFGTKLDVHGRPEPIGTRLLPDPKTAPVVKRIFELYSHGLSPREIAKLLNAEGVPSPGASWNRKVRRADGWQRTSIPSILGNVLYRGAYIWNRTDWVKDPDTGIRSARERPTSPSRWRRSPGCAS